MSDDNSTVVITDIRKALASSEEEAKQKPACLLVVGGELNGSIFNLEMGETVIGRNPDCTIALDFHGVSRKHFTISLSKSNKVVSKVLDISSAIVGQPIHITFGLSNLTHRFKTKLLI